MAKMWMILSVLASLVVFSTQLRTDITINKETQECGSSNMIDKDAEFRLLSTAQSPHPICKFRFTGQAVGDCQGLCYMFGPTSLFKDPNVKMEIKLGSKTVVFDKDNMNYQPVCTTDMSMTVTLHEEEGYKFSRKSKGYNFLVDVYNKCSDRGMATIEGGITFDEAVKKIDGYHHGEERETREKNTYVAGILLGFGLASIFLVVLLIGYCYVRNSPNRGPNRSVGMPKVGGFKKNMKPNKAKPAATEMGVRYTVTDTNKPESNPLLESGKTPAEGTVVVSVDEGN